ADVGVLAGVAVHVDPRAGVLVEIDLEPLVTAERALGAGHRERGADAAPGALVPHADELLLAAAADHAGHAVALAADQQRDAAERGQRRERRGRDDLARRRRGPALELGE